MRQTLESSSKPSKIAAAIRRLGPCALCAALFFSAACARGTTAGENQEMAKEEATNTLGTATQIRLDQPAVNVRLPVATSGPASDRLRQALTTPAARVSAELVLDGIAVSQPPVVQFNVYLSAVGPNSRRQYVGTLSFFGVDYRSGHADLPGRTFDVTEQLQAIRGKGLQLSELQVTFEATDGTAESTPEKAGPQLNRKAGLQVGSVRLRVHGKP